MGSRHCTQGSIWFCRKGEFDSTKQALLLKRAPSVHPHSVRHCAAAQPSENSQITALDSLKSLTSGTPKQRLLEITPTQKPEQDIFHLTLFWEMWKKDELSDMLVHTFHVFGADPAIWVIWCMKEEREVSCVRCLAASPESLGLTLDAHRTAFS